MRSLTKDTLKLPAISESTFFRIVDAYTKSGFPRRGFCGIWPRWTKRTAVALMASDIAASPTAWTAGDALVVASASTCRDFAQLLRKPAFSTEQQLNAAVDRSNPSPSFRPELQVGEHDAMVCPSST